MKHIFSSFCMRIVLLPLLFSFPLLHAQKWSVESGKADISYDKKNGILKITTSPEQKGNLVLRIDKEIPLRKNDLRIYAEVACPGAFSLTWIVAADNEREYEFPTEQIRGGVWTKTVSEYIGGERTALPSFSRELKHPRFKALPVGIAGMIWNIQGKKEILVTGIQGDSREYLKERRWEIIQKTSQNRFPGLNPFGSGDVILPLDRILPMKKGVYEVTWTLTDHFQGKPLKGNSFRVSWNPDDRIAVRKQTLPISLPPGTHTFRIHVKVRNEQGYLVERYRYAAGSFRDGIYTVQKCSENLPPFSDGHLAVTPSADNFIFPSPDSVQFRLSRTQGPPVKKIRIIGEDTSFIARGTRGIYLEIPWNPNAKGEQTISVPGMKSGAACRMKISLLDPNGKQVDQEDFIIGIQNKNRNPVKSKLSIKQPGLAEMFPENRVNINNCDIADFFGTVYIPAKQSFETFYRNAVEKWKQCRVTTVRLSMAPEEVYPLPNFFDSRSVELRTRILREAGLSYNFALSRTSSPVSPEWFDYHPEENYMGLSWVRRDSETSPAASVENQKEIFDCFYGLYKNDPNFMGWVLWSDLFIRDPYRGGFCPEFQKMFSRFLAEVKGVRSNKDLNHRYGTQNLILDQTLIPVPEVDRKDAYGAETERFAPLFYRDLLEFKAWILKETQFDLIRHIRKAGETRALGFYGIPTISVEYYLDDLIKQGVFHTIGREGSVYHDTLRNQAYPTFYRKYHFLNEYTAFTPGCEFGNYWTDMKERDCDRLLSSLMMTGGNQINFTMLYAGPDFPGLKCGTTEQFWKYPPDKLKKFFDAIRIRQDAGLERQTKWVDAIHRGFIRSKIIPWKMGVLSHGVCGGNSGGKGIGEYLTPEYPFHLLKDFSGENAFSDQKLIWIPESPGLFHFDADFSDAMKDKLVRFVQNGGNAVFLSPDAGRYTSQNPEKQYAMLSALGWKNPSLLSQTIPMEDTAKTIKKGIFKKSSTLYFKGPRSKISTKDLPNHHVVEAVFSDGTPACVRWKSGKGEVLLFFARLDLQKHHKTSFVDDLTLWSGFEWPVRISTPVFHTLTREKDTFYLMLYRENKKNEPVTGSVSIQNLPEGQYLLEEMGPTPYDSHRLSSAEIKKGFTIEIPVGMRLIRLKPISKENK